MSNRVKSTLAGVVFHAASHTLDFSVVGTFDLSRLFAVIHARTGATLYRIGKPGFGATALAGNVLTLQVDTSAYADGDPLTIQYDQDSEANAKLEAIRALLGGPALPIAEQQLRGVRDIGDGVGIMRTALDMSGLVKVPFRSAACITTPSGTSTIAFSGNGNPLNNDRSDSAVNMNAASGSPNGCTLRTVVYGKRIALKYRKQSTSPDFAVGVNGDIIAVRNALPMMQGQTFGALVDPHNAVMIMDDLPDDGPHTVAIYLSADALISKTLVLFHLLLESRVGYEPPTPGMALIATGAVPTVAAGFTRTVNNATYAGFRTVRYFNPTGATINVNVKYGANSYEIVPVLAGKHADFNMLDITIHDGSTTTFNHLADAVGLNYWLWGKN